MVMARKEALLTRPFLLVWALTFLTFFAAFQLFPTVPLRLRELGATLGESGRFLSVFTAGSALGALFTGPLGDRLGHRRMVIASAFLFALFTGAYGLVRQTWGIYLVALPHGVVWSGLLTSTMATLSHVIPESRRIEGLALYGLASPSGVFFGPTLALWITGKWGFPPIAFFLAVIFVGLSLYARTLPGSDPAGTKHSAFRLPEPIVLLPCLVLFASALGYGALNSYSAQEAKALAFRFPSAFFTALAVGMVGMRLAMTRIGFGARPARLLPWMIGAASLGSALMAALPGGEWRHVLSGFLYGAGYSMMHTLVNAYVLDRVSADRRGAAFGATLFAFDSGIGLGAFALGALIGWKGYRWGWAAGTLLLLVSFALSFRISKSARGEAGPGGP
jgi:MFS family permease